MSTSKAARAVSKASKTRAKMEALQAELLEAERQADCQVGEAVRLAVTRPRSRWATHAHKSVAEFYDLVVNGEPDTAPIADSEPDTAPIVNDEPDTTPSPVHGFFEPDSRGGFEPQGF